MIENIGHTGRGHTGLRSQQHSCSRFSMSPAESAPYILTGYRHVQHQPQTHGIMDTGVEAGI